MNRIYHHWEKWECVMMGMYKTVAPNDMPPDEVKEMYAEFLRDTPRFETALARVINEWPISCEQFLSNQSSNRIAWLGQSSMCIETGIPFVFRAGFKLLTNEEQRIANATAGQWLKKWQQSQQTTDFEFGTKSNSTKRNKPKKIPNGVRAKIRFYVDLWKDRGYPNGIPDKVPSQLAKYNLAPSYKAVAVALLQNDLHLTSLGFTAPYSKWYGAIKRIEIAARPKPKTPQPTLWELT